MDTLSDLLDAPRAYFLEIPSECRLLIYRYVFADSQMTIDPDGSTDRTFFDKTSLQSAITQTCHILRRESLPLLWSDTELVFTEDFEDANDLKDAFDLQSRYGQNFLLNATRVCRETCFSDPWEQDHLTALPRLRHLTVKLWISEPPLLQFCEGPRGFACYLGADDPVFRIIVEQIAMDLIPSQILDRKTRVNRCQLLFDAQTSDYEEEGVPRYTAMVSHASNLPSKILTLIYCNQRVLLNYDTGKILRREMKYPPTLNFFESFSGLDFDLLDGGVIDEMLEDGGVAADGEHYNVELQWYGETDVWGWPELDGVHY